MQQAAAGNAGAAAKAAGRMARTSIRNGWGLPTALALLALPAAALAQTHAELANLAPSAGTLAPAFASNTFSYATSVPGPITTMTVTPTAADTNATITVNGSPVASGHPSGAISLNPGNNAIATVVVSADTAATNTYTLSVMRNAPVIYEPFADSDATLNGNTPGTGLSGKWLAATIFSVTPGSLTYGTLPVSGNKVTYVSPFANAASSVAIGPALSAAGLLADGATLWFSIVVNTPPTAGINPDTGFAIGTDALGSGNNLPMPAGGQGIGWTIKQGKLQASTWNNGVSRGNTGPAVNASTTMLIVGEIVWGADGTANDTINLYLPDTGLSKGPVVNTRTAVLNQANFDTITSSLKVNAGYGFDEIRFGATYAAMVGVSPAYWDLDGATAGAGSVSPAGTWDGSNTYWNTDSTGGGGGSIDAWTAGQTACFAAGKDATGAYTVTVDGVQDIGDLSFEEGAVTLSGGGLRMTADMRVSVDPNLTATIGSPLSHDPTARQISKTGSGTLVLAGANSYTGPTTVNAGVLRLGADNTLDADNNVVLAGGALDMGGFSNRLGTLAVTGSGSLVLGAGSLSFLDSSALAWPGTLTLLGRLGPRAVRFGAGASALTSAQLEKISIDGSPVGIDAEGYLVSGLGGMVLIVR